jgi:type III secretion protein J
MRFKKLIQWMVVGALSVSLAACETAEVLYTKLPERDVNEMIAVLSTSGIAADRANKIEEKEGVMYDLQIKDNTQFAQAIKTLSVQGYPRKSYKNFGDVFKGDGMVSTPLEQKARYLYALSEELSQTLNEIDGIKNARVHIVLSEVDPISRQRMPASSSVMIQHETRMDTTTLIPKVKKLLSTAIDGLAYENINVILFAEGAARDIPAENLAQAAALSAAQKASVEPVPSVQSPLQNPSDTVLTPAHPASEILSEGISTGSIVLLLIILLLSIVILVFIVMYLKRRDMASVSSKDIALYE